MILTSKFGIFKNAWSQSLWGTSQKLHLEFTDGKITGTSRDSDGAYTLIGSYSIKDGTVTLVKSYKGERAVQHEGEAYQGWIMGRWRKRMTDARGLWRIWPLDKDKADSVTLDIPKVEGPLYEIDGLFEDGEQESTNE